MKFFEASSVINAPAESVWKVLVDSASYPSWDSGVTKVDGTIALGNPLKLYVTAFPGRAFPVKVAELEASKKMTWRGGMPLGAFTGVRTFVLASQGSAVKFTMREEFTGWMLPLIGSKMPDLQPSFDQFVNGLKKRVESGG